MDLKRTLHEQVSRIEPYLEMGRLSCAALQSVQNPLHSSRQPFVRYSVTRSLLPHHL